MLAIIQAISNPQRMDGTWMKHSDGMYCKYDPLATGDFGSLWLSLAGKEKRLAGLRLYPR